MAIIKEEVTEKYRDGTTKTYVRTDILGTTISNTADTIGNLSNLAIYAYMRNDLKKKLAFNEIATKVEDSLCFLEDFAYLSDELDNTLKYVREKVKTISEYRFNEKEKEELEKEIKAYFEKDILISNKVHSPRFGYNRSSGKVELDNIYIKMENYGLIKAINEIQTILELFNNGIEKLKLDKGEYTVDEYFLKLGITLQKAINDSVVPKVRETEMEKIEEEKKAHSKKLEDGEKKDKEYRNITGRSNYFLTIIGIFLINVVLYSIYRFYNNGIVYFLQDIFLIDIFLSSVLFTVTGTILDFFVLKRFKVHFTIFHIVMSPIFIYIFLLYAKYY